MPKCLQITPHLSVEELEQRYRQAKDGVERSHYQINHLASISGSANRGCSSNNGL